MKRIILLFGLMVGLSSCAPRPPTSSDAASGLALYNAFIAQAPAVYSKSMKYDLPSVLWTVSRGNGMVTIIIRDLAFDEKKKSFAKDALRSAMRLTNTRKVTLVFTAVILNDGGGVDSVSDEHIIEL